MPGTQLTPSDFLVDPLTDITRRERRNLLATSVLGLLAAYADLVPTRVSALGVDFGLIEQRAYVWLLCAVTVYFFLAFVACGLSDRLNWEIKYRAYLLAAEIQNENWSLDDQQAYDDRPQLHGPIRRLYQRSHWVAKWRVEFEFFVPWMVSIIAIASLVWKAMHL